MHVQKLLIANRGEIAVRIINACRERGIVAVAVYSAADRSAMHVRLADQAVPIGEAAASASYLRIDAIIEAAQQVGAQAIHPGYGFLSERAALARACREAGLLFIGPPAEAIELLGSKAAAKQLAQSVGVPVVPGYQGDDQRDETLREAAATIGYPLLIKASAGGGGRGMRIVKRPDDLAESLDAARREARAAFGDDTLLLERLIERPRHIEVQVLADTHGNCVHLFERDCSIQRRHQKLVEESPAVGLSDDVRAAMGAAAVRLAKAAGYHNAGTVEFVLDTAGNFYFLEMNTRLQVEHPVTELVTDVDLVQLQISIAEGQPLPFSQADLSQHGHAIEVRVCAEDPSTYLPSIGRLALFAPAQGPGVRNDVGVASGDEVSIHYDAMIAKLIVHGTDRDAALRRLRRALAEYTVLGVTTNLPLLRAIVESSLFIQGGVQTDFLEQSGLAGASFAPAHLPDQVLIAAALADLRASQQPTAEPWQCGPWQLLGNGLTLRYQALQAEHTLHASQTAQGWQMRIGQTDYHIEQIANEGDWVAVRFVDQQIERFAIAEVDGVRLVGWRGQTFELARRGALNTDQLGGQVAVAAGHASLVAPMPGTIIKVLVGEGDTVVRGQPLVVLEAMKMEHVVVAPHDGVVEKLHVSPGNLVAKSVTVVEISAV